MPPEGRVAAEEGTNPRQKKLHGRAFFNSIGSPKFVIAPMVDQSEFAWRMLTRSFMTPPENSKLLAYTPMLHARLFQETPRYRETHFQATAKKTETGARSKSAEGAAESSQSNDQNNENPHLDGNPAFDRPLFVQFCANEPEHLLAAAKLVAPYCDAIDLNLGCPQGIARKGHYGAFLQEDQKLIYRLINTLHKNLSIPVTAKIRILETKEATLGYARNVLEAGASIITVHGRRREQKGHMTGVADWSYLRHLRKNLPPETVIFANGNILQHGDVEACLKATSADAVMSAEGNLSDPAIFATLPTAGEKPGREFWRGKNGKGGWRVDAVFRRYMDIIHRYVLHQDPPVRRPLFVVGDPDDWLRQKDIEADEEEEGPARKKRRKDGRGGGAAKRDRCEDPNLLAMRPHLFHLLRHFVSRHTDIRDALAQCRAGEMASYENVLDLIERRIAEGLTEYERTDGKSIEEDMKIRPPAEVRKTGTAPENDETCGPRADEDAKAEVEEEDDPLSSISTIRRCKRPWWIAQPIIRPLPNEALAKGALSLSKKEKKRLTLEPEAGAQRAKGAPVLK